MSAIVVLVKQVPDYETENNLDENYCLAREGIDKVLDETNEHAVEAALQLRESSSENFELIALSMGPESAETAVRRAIAMNADSGILVNDDRIAGSDVIQTSWVLANALSTIPDVSLVICGDQSSDGGAGSVPAIIAEYLGIPAVTSVSDIAWEDATTLVATRKTDGKVYRLSADLPAIVSVTEQSNEPRFPSFKSIMAAKKKDLTRWNIGDIGVTETQVGLASAGSRVISTQARAGKKRGEVFQDNGDGAQRILDYLQAENLLLVTKGGK